MKDIRAAERFHEEVVGLPHLYTYGNLAFFDCGGARLFLCEGDGDDGASILCFRVAGSHRAARAIAARPDRDHSRPAHDPQASRWRSGAEAFFKEEEGRPRALMAQAKPQAVWSSSAASLALLMTLLMPLSRASSVAYCSEVPMT